jgi:FdhD protein
MRPADIAVPGQAFAYGRSLPADAERSVAAEVPVNIVYGGVPFAVMMATPADIEDFVTGFSLTEGVIESLSDIRAIEIFDEPEGIRALVTLSGEKLQQHLARARSLAGRTGCGVCGVQDLAGLAVARPRAKSGGAIDAEAVGRALGEIESHQSLNMKTRAVHAAAWCDAGGGIELVREDVGRHNALDKLIGALARDQSDVRSGFLLLTSRCSFEMIEKAAVAGISIVVAISAPTALAIERARIHDMTLVAVARRDGAVTFTRPDRIRHREAS